MHPLVRRLEELRRGIGEAYERLGIDQKAEDATRLEAELAAAEIWVNPQVASDKSKQLAALQATVSPWQTLKAQADDMQELMDLGDDSLLPEFEGQIDALETELVERQKELLFKGPLLF